MAILSISDKIQTGIESGAIIDENDDDPLEKEKVTFRLPVRAAMEFGDVVTYIDWTLQADDIEKMEQDAQRLKEIGYSTATKSLPTMAKWEDEAGYRIQDEFLTVADLGLVTISSRPMNVEYGLESMPISVEGLRELHRVTIELEADTVDFIGNEDEITYPGEYVYIKNNDEVIAIDSHANVFGINEPYVDDLLEQAHSSSSVPSFG